MGFPQISLPTFLRVVLRKVTEQKLWEGFALPGTHF